MSHHFDTTLAKQDPSLNLCDLYLFPGAPGRTVMAMTVNPDLGLSAPDTLHIEAIYALRFDLNRDAREELVFKFRFAEPLHGKAGGPVHIQKFQVRRATADAIGGEGGEVLIEAETGKIQREGNVRVFVGAAPDLFAGDASALHAFLNAFYKERRFNGEALLNRQNYFAKRNLTALVLEVPTEMIGPGAVGAWATISLFGHAPEKQIQRWGLPLMTHLFLSAGESLKEQFNTATPSADLALFAKPIAEFIGQMTAYAQSAADPAGYARQALSRLCPSLLPYRLGTPAAFEPAGFNGRALADDAMDVMLTLASGKPLADGVAPDGNRIRDEFPYFGDPYSPAEQAGVTPVPRPQ